MAFSRGPGRFGELREAGRNYFHLSWYLSVSVVTSYGQKPSGGNFFVRRRYGYVHVYMHTYVYVYVYVYIHIHIMCFLFILSTSTNLSKSTNKCLQNLLNNIKQPFQTSPNMSPTPQQIIQTSLKACPKNHSILATSTCGTIMRNSESYRKIHFFVSLIVF